jgi:hypothetical protein
MRHALPHAETVRAVIALALRAPSIHNSQPWRWVTGDNSVHLFADPDRQLPITDPDSRDLLVSCGAARRCTGYPIRHDQPTWPRWSASLAQRRPKTSPSRRPFPAAVLAAGGSARGPCRDRFRW